MSNQLKNCTNQLLKNFKKEVFSSFKDNIWGADLADMQLISKFNKGTGFLLCVIDIFSKYPWVVPLKDKKGIIMLFKKLKIIQRENQIKYWQIKAINFTIVLLNNGYKIMIQKCIQHTMKKNLLLLNYLLQL